MTPFQTAAWLKGREMRGACELVVIREWDPTQLVLLCCEPGHSTAQHRLDVEQALPQAQGWIEFASEECAVLAEILRPLSEPLRRLLRLQVLQLKRFFGGAVVSREQYLQAVASLATAGGGSSSPAASPRKTTRSASRAPASASSPSASATPRNGSAASITSSVSRDAGSPPSLPTTPCASRSSSFAERLKKHVRVPGTGGGATP